MEWSRIPCFFSYCSMEPFLEFLFIKHQIKIQHIPEMKEQGIGFYLSADVKQLVFCIHMNVVVGMSFHKLGAEILIGVFDIV